MRRVSVALTLGNLAAARGAFDEAAFRTPGRARLATYITAGYVAACGAKCRRFRVLRDVAAAGGAFHKAAHDALVLVRLAAQFVALDLAALGAKLDAALGL